MEALPPIPTPFPQRWREFRIQILPIIVFLITLGLIVYLWRTYVHPSEIVGQVEMVDTDVTTVTQGSIEELLVDRFEVVAQGQPICRIVTDGTALTEASLQAIAADMKLMQARMNLDKFRNQNALLGEQMNLLNEQVALEFAQIRLKQAENELKRYTALFEEHLVSEGMPLAQGQGLEPSRFNFGLDAVRRDHDLAKAEVANRKRTVAKLEQEVKRMAASPMVKTEPTDPVVEEAIRAKQQELRLLNQPVVLKAPIDGVVTQIRKRAGEKVVRGENIVTISAAHPSRIVGYVRQPINRLPSTNDTVIVSTRAQLRQMGQAQILKIGAQLEPINPLLLSPDATKVELGLPFLVSVPKDMRLIPGEFVDLEIQYAKR